jgi:UDP-glucuronate 4-epimerase
VTSLPSLEEYDRTLLASRLPATIVITGCAGFIGQRTSELLLELGIRVIGIDSLQPYLYPAEPKRKRLAALQRYPNFHFHELDLRSDFLTPPIDQAEAVVHFAAMAGLAPSWSDPGLYESNNILATARLLDAMTASSAQHIVHASTSSVYGANAVGDESLPLQPISPYGETKAKAETLVLEAQSSGGLSATILRFFSVFGPEQRPDMAYAKAIRAIQNGEEMFITGDGSQSRSNTYIDDAAMAAILAVSVQPSAILNISGTESTSLNAAISHIEAFVGKPAHLTFVPNAQGDQIQTLGDSTKAHQLLQWRPTVSIRDGLKRQVAASGSPAA